MRSSLVLSTMALFAVACSSSSSSQNGTGNGATDAGSDATVATGADASAATDAASSSAVDAAGSGAVCTFNADCPSAERCECDEATGCFCHIGARGTGKNGVDTCKDGNDCETALCVEGPSSVYYCSGPCMTASDCKSMLPMCIDVAGIGRICTR